MSHLLIIEDDVTLQKVYSEVLRQEGYEITTVGTGPDGMNALEKESIQLILLDIMLPGGMNGFDILQQLKRNDKLKSVPVIVLTNLDTEKQAALDFGAIDFFVKSNMELHTLVEKIKNHLAS